MQKPKSNITLGSHARTREWQVLLFIYESDSGDVCKYDVFKHFCPDCRNQKEYEVALFDLNRQGLIKDERMEDYGLRIVLTTEGKEFVRYYQSAEDLL